MGQIGQTRQLQGLGQRKYRVLIMKGKKEDFCVGFIFIYLVLLNLLWPGRVLGIEASSNELSRLAKELATLQNDVELLYDQIDSVKTSLKNEARAFEQQKVELEADIQRKELTYKKLKIERDRLSSEIAEKSKKNESLRPIVLYGISLLEDYIKQGLPFRRKERLKLLEDLKGALDPEHPKITPERAINTLWAYYEDEIRLATDSGLYKEVLDIKGKKLLADVAKLGMVAMFFYTPHGDVGVIRNEEGFFPIHLLRDPEQHEMVLDMMDAFRKQVKTGYFILPNFLPEVDADVNIKR